MANGLPITDPASGYNPMDPWTNREPRFYKNIAIDGEKWWATSGADMYAQLYNGGRHRSIDQSPECDRLLSEKIQCLKSDIFIVSSRPGYGLCSVPATCRCLLNVCRGCDFQSGGYSAKQAGNYTLTAEQAINVVRNRAQIANLTPAYTANKDIFFEEIVRERAVELAFRRTALLRSAPLEQEL